MLQSGSCNGCGECPDAPVEVTSGGGGLDYVRRVYVTFSGPSREDCEATDVREIELRAFYSKYPYGNLDHEYAGPPRDGAIVPTDTEPAVWATMIASALAFQHEIESPYWLDDDNRLRCKAKYIYTAYAYGQNSIDHTVLGGDGKKLLPVLAWLMPDPDDEQKCIWQAIAMCGICGEVNVYNDAEVIVGTETFPPQPAFVCALEYTTQRWEHLEVTIYRTSAVAWTGKIRVDRNCPVGVPDLPLFFEQPNPCDCTPPTPAPECCSPQLYLTWKKTGGTECCGTDSAGRPNICQDFVEPVPDTNTLFTQIADTKNLQEVFISGQPDTRQWVAVWQLEHAGNGVGDGTACSEECDEYYCRYALFVMVQCCTDSWYYKWEWVYTGRRNSDAASLWYNYYLPLWGPLGCIGDPITMDGTDCSCDFPNLPITTIGPFPGCDCQIEFEIRQHPLSTCEEIQTECCTKPIPRYPTVEVSDISVPSATVPVGYSSSAAHNDALDQWQMAFPSPDTDGLVFVFKCCDPGGGAPWHFGWYTNTTDSGNFLVSGELDCTAGVLSFSQQQCDPLGLGTNYFGVVDMYGTGTGIVDINLMVTL